jgi:hypothetical protein
LSNNWIVRREKLEQTQSGIPVIMEAEVGVRHLQVKKAKDCQQSPEAKQKQGRILP